jgi:GNAT superfamily N-acetyltransferase
MPKKSLEFRISSDLKEITLASLHEVESSVGFLRGSPENLPDGYLENLFGTGIFGFFAFHENDLVGVARILTDDYVVTFVAELCVHKQWQRKGVGRLLMEAIIERFDDTAIYVDAFVGQEEFFKEVGIKPQSMLVACGRAPRGIPHK